MKNLIIPIMGCVIALIGIYTVASAVNPFDISYPIPELGNCASQEECKNYCDNPSSQRACIEWAEKQGVFSAVEAKRMKDLSEMENRPDDPVSGPGGCKSPKQCDAYCRLLENLEECLQYGVQHGYTSAEEAQKIREQANKGGPGGCKSKEQCDSYCKNPGNVEECMKFVVEEGKITQEEANTIIEMTKKGGIGKPEGPKIDEQKAIEALKFIGEGPGGCKNVEECRFYCEDFSHAEECLAFATKHGFMPPEEAERAKKMVRVGGPGGCKTPQECDTFCSKEENRDTCFNFARDNGFISQEEAMMVEKQMMIIKKLDVQAGPGGCMGPEECNAYCSNPSKVQECMNFAAETGMMSKESVESMMQQMQRTEQMKEFFMMKGAPPSEMMPPQGGAAPNLQGEMQMPQERKECCSCCPPDAEQCVQSCCPCEEKDFVPPEGFIPPEKFVPPADMQYQMSPEGFAPPSGEFILPPEEYIPPPEESSPPPETTEPTGFRYSHSLLGTVIGPFLEIFR